MVLGSDTDSPREEAASELCALSLRRMNAYIYVPHFHVNLIICSHEFFYLHPTTSTCLTHAMDSAWCYVINFMCIPKIKRMTSSLIIHATLLST